MKNLFNRKVLPLVIFVATGASCGLAATRYVSHTGSTRWPYTSWETASTNMQYAIDTAVAGDTVLVDDGHYILSSTINIIGKNITLESVNGPPATIIDGDYPNRSIRCIYVSNSEITLRGFTIQNGYLTNDSGGGLCIINSQGGHIDNCIFNSNHAASRGGGCYFDNVRLSVFTKCVFSNNVAGNSGGGFYGYYGDAIFERCNILENTANSGVGGIYCSSYYVKLYSCVIANNTGTSRSGVDGGTLENCTVVGNHSLSSSGTAISGSKCRNCIIRYNSCKVASSNPNYSGGTYESCCTEPQVPDSMGKNNFTLPPDFVDWANGDYRLLASSQCIDTGDYQDWMSSSTDFLGNPRMNGVVDRGAYEYPSSSSPVQDEVVVNIGLGVEISWNSQVDTEYLVQSTDDLTDVNSWQNVDQRIGTGGVMSSIFSSRDKPKRFFRVISSQQ